jgi:hypothetical protein
LLLTEIPPGLSLKKNNMSEKVSAGQIIVRTAINYSIVDVHFPTGKFSKILGLAKSLTEKISRKTGMDNWERMS